MLRLDLVYRVVDIAPQVGARATKHAKLYAQAPVDGSLISGRHFVYNQILRPGL
jgi:hypothetical protein